MNTLQITTAKPDDVTYLIYLQKVFSNNLGFLPRLALEEFIAAKNVQIAMENDQPAGFILTRPLLQQSPRVSPIVQAAVQMDAQKRHIGLALVNQHCDRAHINGSAIVQCWCAADIEAREFWKIAGFTEIARREPVNKRQRELILYRRALIPLRIGQLTSIPRFAGCRGTAIDVPGQSMLFNEPAKSRFTLIDVNQRNGNE